jgi:hypothetical protein
LYAHRHHALDRTTMASAINRKKGPVK